MSGPILAVLLAAGGSSRMGAPKQLLDFEGASLVRRAALAALGCACDGVVAVLGAHAEAVARELAGLELVLVRNPDWAQGIGGSIRCGVEAALERAPDLDALLLLLADQPGVSAALLDRILAERRERGAELVACAYAGSLGVPALFGRPHLDALRALSGDRGAKSILLEHEARVRRVSFPEGVVDVDTPQDYEQLRRSP
jgi:molybdenum cofactor cytidylyltransferase